MKNSFIITAILVIVVGAGAFFAGLKYQQSKQASLLGGNRDLPAGRQGFSGAGGNSFRQGGARNGGGAVRGEILSADDESITVKMPDGSSKIVFVSDTTAVTEATAAGKASLQVGKQVTVFGTANADGSVTAQTVQMGNFLFGPR